MKKVIKLRPVLTFRVIFWGTFITIITGIASEFLFFEYVEIYLNVPPPPIEQTTIKRLSYSGLASWYDYELSEGDGYSAKNLTAASRDFPKGTCLAVDTLDNIGRVYVRVNDVVENHGVLLDLSSRAFSLLANLSVGLIKVEIREVNRALCK